MKTFMFLLWNIQDNPYCDISGDLLGLCHKSRWNSFSKCLKLSCKVTLLTFSRNMWLIRKSSSGCWLVGFANQTAPKAPYRFAHFAKVHTRNLVLIQVLLGSWNKIWGESELWMDHFCYLSYTRRSKSCFAPQFINKIMQLCNQCNDFLVIR